MLSGASLPDCSWAVCLYSAEGICLLLLMPCGGFIAKRRRCHAMDCYGIVPGVATHGVGLARHPKWSDSLRANWRACAVMPAAYNDHPLAGLRELTVRSMPDLTSMPDL